MADVGADLIKLLRTPALVLVSAAGGAATGTVAAGAPALADRVTVLEERTAATAAQLERQTAILEAVRDDLVRVCVSLDAPCVPR